MPVYVIQVQLFNGDKKHENLFKCGYTANNVFGRVKGVVQELRTAGYKEARAGLWWCLLDGDIHDERRLLWVTDNYTKLVEKRFPGTYFTEYRKYDAAHIIFNWFKKRGGKTGPPFWTHYA